MLHNIFYKIQYNFPELLDLYQEPPLSDGGEKSPSEVSDHLKGWSSTTQVFEKESDAHR